MTTVIVTCFLCPDLMRYDVKHSYIIELKYLSAKDSEAKAEVQWQEAVEQIKGYAVGAKVRQMVHGTELHCIVMQFRGWELERWRKSCRNKLNLYCHFSFQANISAIPLFQQRVVRLPDFV